MSAEEPGRGRWLRPLGLFLLALTLTMGQPAILVVVTFAILTFLASAGVGTLLVAGAITVLVFAGEPTGGMWYVERGWAILAGGTFAAVTLAWPQTSFVIRGLAAVAGGTLWSGLVVGIFGGWNVVESLVVSEVRTSVSGTVELLSALGTGGLPDPTVMETLDRTAEVQSLLFPALLGLSTLASLGAAWWLHVRVTEKSDGGLGSLKEFRFPDPLIWLVVVGALLVLVAEWSVGWGRLGTNLLTFMGGLYVLRGAGVALFLMGGVSLLGGLFLLLGLVFSAPVLLAASLAVGLGDSWFDLRARVGSRGESEG